MKQINPTAYERLVLNNWAFGHDRTGLFDDGSFCGVLHEQNIWNEELYWPLDQAFFEIGHAHTGVMSSGLLIEAITDTFLYVHGRLNWHRMESDLSVIDSFTTEDCRTWAERIEGAFRVALYNAPLKNTHFSRINPLVV